MPPLYNCGRGRLFSRTCHQSADVGQELTALLSGMTASPAIMTFIARHNCPEYLKESGRLQIRLKEEALREECERSLGR
ncbi:MAG: hypothetical protein MR426_03795 [Clostridiales bacterium]|nr:hypothetical protein [Clostridiales bacterium]